MDKYIELSPMEIRLGFVASCIEFVARELKKPYIEIYRRMNKLGMIDAYIYKHYNTIHTESREHITEDLINYMNEEENRI